MTDSRLDPLSRALRHAARSDEPRALSDARAREMVARALAARAVHDEDAAPERLPLRSPISAWAIAGAALALAAAASMLAWAPRPSDAIPSAPAATVEAARSTLPSGDQLFATPGAEYDVESVTARRRVRLTRGSVLCDVRALGAGSGFTLSTPHVEIEVLGTVFSARVEGDRTDVWVYEGRVRVVAGAEERVLEAGQSTTDESVLDPLGAEGAAARDRRASSHAARPARASAHDRGARTRAQPRATQVEGRREQPELSPARATLDEVRALLARDRAREALARADAELARGESADWLVLRADALRALGRPGDAVATLERAVAIAPGRRHTIGYRIASERWRGLRDARGALDALARHGVTEQGSALAERGLALQIDLTEVLHLTTDRRRAIDAYLARFPDTTRARALRDRR